jgi:hypothetical protein
LDSDYASKEDVWISDTTAPPEVMAHFELGSGTGGSYAELRVLRAASQDQFGTSVAVDGDYVAVGALYHDHNGHSSAGSVYAFLRTGTTSWDAGTKIAAADPDAQDFLGISVAIDGQKLIAGATGADDTAQNSGNAYVFRRTGANSWDSGSRIVPSEGSDSDEFGVDVGLAADYGVVADRFDDDEGQSSGSAYVIDFR